jgi:uncharacterized membrane protein
VDQIAEKPERLVFFSDAVIAIALTLLGLDLPIPLLKNPTNGALWSSFNSNWRSDYFPFLLSFAVIAVFWNAHHTLFRRVDRLGRLVTPLNFLFLLAIVLVPFVTRVHGVDGNYQVGVVLYAADLAALALTIAALAYVVKREGLLVEGVPPSDMDRVMLAMAPTALVFLLSIPVAIASPKWATELWLLLLVATRFAGALYRRLRPDGSDHEENA